MPAAACQRRPQPHLAALFRRSILSLSRHPRGRRRRPSSASSDADVIPTHQINLFHTHVARLFHSLLPAAASDDDLLSLPWLRRLLDGFLSCLHHFEPLLVAVAGSDDRFVSDVLDLAVKALDLCNVVSAAADGLVALRRRAGIASSAMARGQLRRARRALAGAGADAGFGEQSWSAAIQLHAMAAGLAAPPIWDEAEAGDAAAMAMHGMATVVAFVMRVLVVAIVPGGAGRQVQLPAPPPDLPWAGAAAAVQERIGEEWRLIKKGGGGGGRMGMMVELRKMEWCAAAAAAAVPASAEAEAVAVEVEKVCRVLEEELDPFQKRVRDVFHGIVRCRTAVVDSFAVVVRER